MQPDQVASIGESLSLEENSQGALDDNMTFLDANVTPMPLPEEPFELEQDFKIMNNFFDLTQDDQGTGVIYNPQEDCIIVALASTIGDGQPSLGYGLGDGCYENLQKLLGADTSKHDALVNSLSTHSKSLETEQRSASPGLYI